MLRWLLRCRNGRKSNKDATIERLRTILADPVKSVAFGPEWLAAVATTVQRQRGILVGVMAASFVPTTYLALFLLGKVTGVELFGFKFEDRTTLFEVSLIATCLLGVYGARMAIITAQGEQLMAAWLHERHGSDDDQLHAFAYDPPLLKPPLFIDPPRMRPTDGTRRVRNCAYAMFYSVAVVVGLAAFATQISALVWAVGRILGNDCVPVSATLQLCSGQPSIMIVAFCVLVTLLNFLAYVPYAYCQSFESAGEHTATTAQPRQTATAGTVPASDS